MRVDRSLRVEEFECASRVDVEIDDDLAVPRHGRWRAVFARSYHDVVTRTEIECENSHGDRKCLRCRSRHAHEFFGKLSRRDGNTNRAFRKRFPRIDTERARQTDPWPQ